MQACAHVVLQGHSINDHRVRLQGSALHEKELPVSRHHDLVLRLHLLQVVLHLVRATHARATTSSRERLEIGLGAIHPPAHSPPSPYTHSPTTTATQRIPPSLADYNVHPPTRASVSLCVSLCLSPRAAPESTVVLRGDLDDAQRLGLVHLRCVRRYRRHVLRARMENVSLFRKSGAENSKV